MSRTMWLWRVIVPGVGLGLCLSIGILSLQRTGPKVRASNPTTKRRVIERVIAEGRVEPRPGAMVTVSTDLGGYVEAVGVKEKATIKKGDLLVSLRTDDRKASLLEAEAKLAEAEAEVDYQKREYQRRVKSSTESKVFTSEIDMTRRDFEVAVARKRGAEAVVAQCRSALARTKMTSPIDGTVLSVDVHAAEVANPGAHLITVCDLTRTRIEAEVDEFDAPRITVGAAVTITAEGFPGTSWRGTVEEVPDRVEPRSLRPEDPGRPTDTRALRVKIGTAKPLPLKLGQQVEVEIRVKTAP